MKLGKPHLVASLALLAGSVVYNLWVFTQPQKTATIAHGPAPVQPLPSRDAQPTTGGPLDPANMAAPPEVAFDRIPEFPRDPFARARDRKPAVTEVADVPAQAPPPEPELVVSSILTSAERRLAIVNGRITRVGDTVGSTTIVDIQPRAIVVDSPVRGRRTIELQMFTSAASRKGARP